MKRYQHPSDAASLPQDELNAMFPSDSRECPDPRGWINELPHTRETPVHRRPNRHRSRR